MKRAVIDGVPALPCVGSGYCCKKTICWEGLKVHEGKEAPCPSLRSIEWEGLKLYRCGLVEDATGEEQLRLDESLSIGAGCCAALNTDRVPIIRKLVSGLSLPFSSSSSEKPGTQT